MQIVVSDVSKRERHPSKMPYRAYDSDFRYRWSHKARKARIYFSPKGETIIDQLYNRRSRPYNAYRTLIPQVLKQLGYTYEEIQKMKFNWSQKAGCNMCPCSPGFLVEGLEDVDIWVSVEAVKG
jgi:glutamate/tyrosine decarboxylase-like PLP-dependent enzyme